MAKNGDYRAVFASETGREVLRDLNKFCFGTVGYLDSAKTVKTSQDGQRTVGLSSIDPLEIARFEGRREVLTMILRRIRHKDLEALEEFIDDEVEGW